MVGADDPVLTREMVADRDWRRDHVRVFESPLRAEPVLRIDAVRSSRRGSWTRGRS